MMTTRNSHSLRHMNLCSNCFLRIPTIRFGERRRFLHRVSFLSGPLLLYWKGVTAFCTEKENCINPLKGTRDTRIRCFLQQGLFVESLTGMKETKRERRRERNPCTQSIVDKLNRIKKQKRTTEMREAFNMKGWLRRNLISMGQIEGNRKRLLTHSWSSAKCMSLITHEMPVQRLQGFSAEIQKDFATALLCNESTADRFEDILCESL